MFVTSFYASALSAMLVALSIRVIRLRRAGRIGLGDGGDKSLLGAVCAHGNFSEYVPLTLILMLIAELSHSPLWMIHALGILLLLGRALHAVGLSCQPEWVAGRLAGMAFTLVALLAGATAILPTWVP